MKCTYTVNNRIHSYFNQNRQQKGEGPGRQNAVAFLQFFKNIVEINDRHPDGSLIVENPDLRYFKLGGRIFFAEAATKRSVRSRFQTGRTPWSCIQEGVDVECRKLKYCPHSLILMSACTKEELVVIPGKYLCMAEIDCGEEFYGQGKIRSSDNFVMPEHGCHRVRKFCLNDENGTYEINDFYRIPYVFVAHFLCKNKDFTLVKKFGQKERTDKDYILSQEQGLKSLAAFNEEFFA